MRVHVNEYAETLTTVVDRDVDPDQPHLYEVPEHLVIAWERAKSALDTAAAVILAWIEDQPDLSNQEERL